MRKEEQKEKNPRPWELRDPKIPVIQSGHMENRAEHLEIPQVGVDKPADLGL